MAEIVGLPKLSPTMEEGTLVAWHKRQGDRIEPDELLAEVETDKATVEFRSFWEGTLLAIVAQEGAVLRPGDPVAIVGQPGENVSALLEQVRAEKAGAGKADEPEPAPAKEPSGEPVPQAAASAPQARSLVASASGASVTPSGRVLASPLVRRLARERGVDLRQVPGSGPGGRIVTRDLERFLDSGGAAAASASVPPRCPARA